MIDKIYAQLTALSRFASELKSESAEIYTDALDQLRDSIESYAISHPEKTDYNVPHYGQKINNFLPPNV